MRVVAFIGLGIMGSPMAVHLQNAGYDVRGFNRSPEKAERLRAAGGTVCTSAAEAAADADVTCLMLPDSPDVEDVLVGDGDVLAHARSGALIIDFSTIRPDAARRLAEQVRTRGLRMLDAPVSGGQAGAENKRLSIMIGGDAEDVDAARDLLEVLGTSVVHVGPSGAGQTVKAANQLIVAGNIAVLAEAVLFLEAHGIELGPALDVLAGGLAGSAVLTQKRENMTSRTFTPGFSLALHNKDLRIVMDAIEERSLVSPMAALLAGFVASAVTDGDGQLDHSGLIRVIERLNKTGTLGPETEDG